ncbi:hypothetical protein FGM00_19615 [Aggregatimonas sangjinii]|uniref:Class I SAM-dependent methyltransferase n=1 Tax=Aggregatimonas sangjinii TaxID=2583587 RepID=A0A5B7SUG4_9FLAO|nr:hypothetical protein [Aggregatimonas sangjinii]QCX02216.1 hypothetical protein FGM00_19615 [Aggregatimonas sangjinii]
MKRIQLFEFEDFDWFPNWLRTCMTNLIIILSKMIGVAEVLAGLVTKTLKEQNQSQIVDLGSGSGGVMPEVLKMVQKTPGLENASMLLTDLYPNPIFIRKFNKSTTDAIEYSKVPIDATDISKAPTGLKTMINSFHHMPPEAAKSILDSAQKNNEPLLIYEMAENKMPLLIWWLLLPFSLVILIIMVLFMTPFVRPLTWKQLVFTYLLPIIPICYAWDGQASLPRMYSFKDIDQLLEGLGSTAYGWEKGYARKKNGKAMGTFIVGFPKS